MRDAMPVIPTWAVNGFTWAPDVHRFGDHYVMWFTAAVQQGRLGRFQDGRGWWIVYGPCAVVNSDPTPRPVALAHVGFTNDGPYVAAVP